MNVPNFLRRTFGRLPGMWVAFATTLIVITLGLGFLSRHALRLQQHERIQQSVRISLWRLDSRLAPMIATIHQPNVDSRTVNSGGAFILERFVVVAEANDHGQPLQYRARPGTESITRRENSAEQSRSGTQPLPVESLLLAIDELQPGLNVAPSGTTQPIDRGEPDRQTSRLNRSLRIPNRQNSAVQSKAQTYGSRITENRRVGNRKGPQQRAAIVQQQVEFNTIPSSSPAPAAINPTMLSVWIDSSLAFIRTRPDGQPGFEGVWIDWKSLHASLIADIEDLLPNATIRPAGKNENIDPESALAALPAVLVPGDAEQMPDSRSPDSWSPDSWSPTHTALLLCWAALAIAALVAGIALSRLFALSERRAAFVSAVTHELRTPLTTFRLYSDLLAREMVSDPADQRSYLETLRREADRLTHLVENVLRYSQLERTHQPVEPESVTVSRWVERLRPRLGQRLHEAGMTLEINQTGDGTWRTDPPAMEQVLFNLIDNAAKYAATAEDKRVLMDVEVAADLVSIRVTDHGAGVPMALRRSMFQPFSKSAQRAAETAAGVGLGLALVKRTVTALGGTIEYSQTATTGASFEVQMPRR